MRRSDFFYSILNYLSACILVNPGRFDYIYIYWRILEQTRSPEVETLPKRKEVRWNIPVLELQMHALGCLTPYFEDAYIDEYYNAQDPPLSPLNSFERFYKTEFFFGFHLLVMKHPIPSSKQCTGYI